MSCKSSVDEHLVVVRVPPLNIKLTLSHCTMRASSHAEETNYGHEQLERYQ
jgi:hypothetical protein